MNDRLDDFFAYVAKAGVFRTRGNLGTPKKLRRYLERLFAGVQIQGKKTMDIGAGTGVFSAYLALKGAASVYALEPEQAGSHGEMAQKFRDMLRRLGIENVTLEAKTIQEILPSIRPRELILLHNCINHFDEKACSQLHYAPAARWVYDQIFKSLNQITLPDGQMIVADSTRYNFFDWLGLKSPLSPSINWKIHQPPEIWIELAGKAGFECQSLRWTAFNHFGHGCQWFLANRIAAFFLLGHFSIVFRKVREVGSSGLAATLGEKL